MTSTLALRVRKKPAGKHYTDTLASLQREFRRRGWHRPATAILLRQYALLLALSLGGLILFDISSDLRYQALGLMLSAIGSLGISTQAHTASHGTVSRAKWLNQGLTYLGFPVVLGLPATYWRHKHISVHHKAPNVHGFDEDINLMPLFALTQDEARKGGRLMRFYHRRLQWLVLLLTLPLIGYNTMLYGLAFLARKLIHPNTRTAAAWFDVGALLLHVLIWIALPMLYAPAGVVLLGYGLRHALLGVGMFAVFAPAHFPAEAVIAHKSQRRANFALRQTTTTVNYRTGPVGRFLCAGVEFQIEHHLFCNYSHVYYPAMSRLVREFCVRHGYPYRSLGWGEALLKSLQAFLYPKPVVKELAKDLSELQG
ncbi:MAG: fatty acid desaturase family protein [Gemmataceae bacterium]